MFSNLLNILFPSKCPVCEKSSDSYAHNPICLSCWGEIRKYEGPSCGICGTPTVSQHTTTCKACMEDSPPYAQILYYGIYEGVLKKAIHLLKFNSCKRLSKPLGSLMSDLSLEKADGIVPVPLHIKGLQQRGFNQTAVLGLQLSKALGIPLMPDVLRKVRETPPQTDVTGKERLKNIKNAFSASGDVKGLNLLLVDDVITTGATVSECSRTLRKAGAKSVTVAALARSMPRL